MLQEQEPKSLKIKTYLLKVQELQAQLSITQMM